MNVWVFFLRLLLDRARVKSRFQNPRSDRAYSPGRGHQSPILGPDILRTIHLGAEESGDKIFFEIFRYVELF